MNSKISFLLIIFCFLHCLINSMDQKIQKNPKSTVKLRYPWVQTNNGIWEYDPTSPLRYMSNKDENSERLDTRALNTQKKSQLNLSKK